MFQNQPFDTQQSYFKAGKLIRHLSQKNNNINEFLTIHLPNLKLRIQQHSDTKIKRRNDTHEFNVKITLANDIK